MSIEELTGSWILTATVPAELPMDGPGRAEPWLEQPMHVPATGWESASGVVLTIAIDSRFTEEVDARSEGGSLDWWELDGTLLDRPAPSTGRVLAAGGQWHLVPDEGIDRVSYRVSGVRHGEDTAEVVDRIVVQTDGTLLRSVLVDQGDGARGRSWYRYERCADPAAFEDCAEESTVETGPIVPLRAGFRIELGVDLAERILADHLAAVRADVLGRRHLHEEFGRPLRPAETEGLADIATFTVGRGFSDDAEAWTRPRRYGPVRLQDGHHAVVLPRPGEDTARPGARPGHLAQSMVEETIAPAVLAARTVDGRGVVDGSVSMMVSDLEAQVVRWIVMLDDAAQSWFLEMAEHEMSDVTEGRGLLPMARALRTMPDEDFTRLPVLGADAPGTSPQPASRTSSPHGADAAAGTGAERSALAASRRVELSESVVEQILADHREAARVDAETTRTLHEQKGFALRPTESEGLAEILALAVGRHAGEITEWSRTGLVHRLQDGSGLRASRDAYSNRRGGRGKKPPVPGSFAGSLIEEQLAPALLAAGTPNENGVVRAASMMVTDLARGTLRWVVLLDGDASRWVDSSGPSQPREMLVPVARALRVMSDEHYARLPLLGGRS